MKTNRLKEYSANLEYLKSETICHSERPKGVKNPAAKGRRPFATLRVTYSLCL
jgi:hypothetical protein